MQNNKSKSIILTIISLGILASIAYLFFTNTKTEELGYSITGSTGVTAPIGTGAIDTTGKKNIQIVAYLSESNGTVEKISADGVASEIKDGEVITKNDTILTKDDSSASLIFIDNSVVRLAANSKIAITRKMGKSIELTLLDGDVWARVLKPLYDTSFFTIKTADVSAGVRGTSIRIKKTSDKITITVIDSYAKDPNQAGADINMKDAKKFLGVEKSIEIDLTNGAHKEKKEDKKSLMGDEFIRENTKKDLVYMDTLKSLTGDSGMIERLSGEFTVTMPSEDEVMIMFDEDQMKDKVGKMLKDKKPMTSDDMFEMIKKDIVISAVKEQIIRQSGGGGGGSMSPEAKKELDQKIGEIINTQTLDFAPFDPLRRQLKQGDEPVDRMLGKDILNLGNPTGTGTTETGSVVPEQTKNDAPDCTPELIKQGVQCRVIEPLPPLDTDKDGIPDGKDNCPKVPNPGQLNTYGDARGNACEPKPIEEQIILDTDKDGIPDGKDNCPKVPNPGQLNTYGDARGNACEPKPVEEPKPITCGGKICLPSQTCVAPVIVSGEVTVPAHCAD